MEKTHNICCLLRNSEKNISISTKYCKCPKIPNSLFNTFLLPFFFFFFYADVSLYSVEWQMLYICVDPDQEQFALFTYSLYVTLSAA